MKKRRWIWWVILAVIAITGTVVGVTTYKKKAAAAAEVHYRTAKVDKRNVVGRIAASGTLSALVTVQVGSQVSGRIQYLYADFNSKVTKGQLIAKIDPQLFLAAVAQASASYQSATAQVTKATSNAAQADRVYERAKSLKEQGVGSQADLDAAEAGKNSALADVGVAKASLATSQANLNQAQVNLSYTSIVSPIDGTVISRSVDVGQTVAASLQAPILFVLAEDLKKMQVDTSVAEGDVGRLAPGMKASFTVDAFPGEKFRGTIDMIRNSAVTLQNVVTYDAVIKVENPELKLRPGMTATVDVTFAEKKDVLAIPNAALRYRPANAAVAGTGSARPTRKVAGAAEKKTIYVLKDNAPVAVEITIGLSDGSYTEIVEGDLAEGADIILDSEGGTAVTTATTTANPFGGGAAGGGRRGGM